MIELPWAALREVVGDLGPGVHAITGPIASGKTQFALQIARHAAATKDVLVLHPWIPEQEIRRRLHGLEARVPWATVETPTVTERPRVGGSRAPAEALVTDDAELFVVDHPQADDAMLRNTRRAALDKGAAVLLVVEPGSAQAVRTFVPPEVRRDAPPEIAAWLGVTPRLASEVDTLLILAPYRPRTSELWCPIDVAVAKHRSRPIGFATLRFNGSWFEDEPAGDIDLGL